MTGGRGAHPFTRSLQRRLAILVLMALGAGVVATAVICVVVLQRLSGRADGDRARVIALADAHIQRALTHDLEQLQALASRLTTGGPATDSAIAVREAYLAVRYFDAVFVADSGEGIVAQEPRDVVISRRALDSATPHGTVSLIDDCETSDPCTTYVILRGTLWQDGGSVHIGGVLDPSSHRMRPVLESLRRTLGDEFLIADARGRGVAFRQTAGRPAVAGLDAATALPWHVVQRERGCCFGVFDGTPPRVALPGLALLVGLLLVFAWGGARTVVQPLAALTRASERMAAGDMDVTLPEPRSDEVGRLSAAFDRMRVSLRAARDEIEDANRRLEERVEARTRELQQLYGELQARERDRARLLRQVISAQEDERKRIARELHDDTCQMLAAAAMQLEAAADKGAAGGDLAEIRRLLVVTIEGVRRQIHDLRPSLLDDLGLVDAIRAHADRHLRAAGISVRFESDAAVLHLTREAEIAVFRAVQELITNVARHAQASHVFIQIAVTDGRLAIDVEDDGRGFEREKTQVSEGGGIGLIGVRERVELAGGRLTIDSAPGEGTHARIELPMPPQHP